LNTTKASLHISIFLAKLMLSRPPAREVLVRLRKELVLLLSLLG
jgi:hypothetical protein